MGALDDHFNELETNHKLEVLELKMVIVDLESELSDVKGKYDSLCSKLKTNANDTRNESEGDRFLRNYNVNRDFWS